MVIIEGMTYSHLDFVLQHKTEEWSIDFLDWENRSVFEKMIELNKETSKIAIDTLLNKPVGFVFGGDTGLRGVLHHLYVSKDYRHLGIGNKLIAECINGFKYKSLGSKRIIGLVYGNNTAAIKILKQNGFIFNVVLEKGYPFVIPCYLDI